MHKVILVGWYHRYNSMQTVKEYLKARPLLYYNILEIEELKYGRTPDHFQIEE